MAEIIIPCDTFVRLAQILTNFPPDKDATWFKAIRYDNGQVIACNRSIMAIENIGGPGGIFHIAADDALVEACRKEAKFNSKLFVTDMPGLKWATAKTTLGYTHPANAGVYPPGPTDFDRWREITMRCKEPAKTPTGGMFWHADDIARLAASSPSGCVTFETVIAANGQRPTIMRDVNDPDWLGVFQPFCQDHQYQPATLPTWMTAR